MAPSPVREDVWAKTLCHTCLNGVCGVLAHRVNGVIVGMKGDPDNPYSHGRLCAKSFSQITTLYDANRPTKPLIRTNPEKGIGVDPRWKEVEWDEALDLAAKKLAEIRKTNPGDFILSHHDVSSTPWQASVILHSFGSPNRAGGSYYCGGAVHIQPYMSMGCFNTFPDWQYVNHVVLWGSNKGGLLQHLGTTAALDLADARLKRGAKLICIDPVQSNIGSKANEWVPIRPGTDLALALAWLNVLLNEAEIYDEEFLRRYTNGPYLIGGDGHYLRDEATTKPLIWDNADATAKPFDSDFKELTLDGSYTVGGVACKTAFRMLREHVKTYTPEWASSITTVPAATTRRLAIDFGKAACIGSTMQYEGHTLPYRPAALHWYGGISQRTNGFLTGLTIFMINTLVGNLMVPGGLAAESSVVEFPYAPRTAKSGKYGWPTESEDGMIIPSNFIGVGSNGYPAVKVEQPKTHTADSLFPLSLAGYATLEINHLHPEAFNNKVPSPKFLFGRHAIDMTNKGNPQEVAQLLKGLFQVSCEPFIDETAEFADIFFPVPTSLERLLVGRGIHARLGAAAELSDYTVPACYPVVAEERIVGREILDIWVELAERAGFLEDLNRVINMVWDLPEGYRLDVKRKYTYKEMQEKAAKGIYGHDLEHFRQEGFVKWHKSVPERYPRPFFKARAPIYFEHFLAAGEEVAKVSKEMGIQLDLSHYESLPSWHPDVSYYDTKPGFDLVSIPYRVPFLMHQWLTHNPMLADLADYHPWGMNIVMNAQTGAARGIKDGDRIVVEGVTGYSVEGAVKLTQCMHPEVVAISAHGGHWAARHEASRGKGTCFNTLVPHNLKQMDPIFSSLGASVRVKVAKAGKEQSRPVNAK